MYTYQVDENEINKKLKENQISSLEDLEKAFKDIDKENGFDFGEVGGYKKEEKTFDRVDVPEIDNEKIKQEATDFYKNEMDQNLDKIETDYQKKADKLNNSKIEVKEDRTKSENKINENFEKNSKQSLYNSVNQGIARSSIENEKQNRLTKIREADLNDLQQETNKKLVNIQNSLNILKTEKEKAMKNFDISYALKISEKMDKLQSLYNKEREEAIKYNEKMEAEEKRFNEQQEKLSKEYDEEVLKKQAEHNKNVEEKGLFLVYGNDVLDQKKEAALEYLYTIPKSEAKQLCLSEYLYNILGPSRTYELYRLMDKRTD